MSITKLELAIPVPREGIIELCRTLLSKAESGELLSITFVGELTGGELMRGNSIGEDAQLLRLIGGLETEKARLIMKTGVYE